MSSRMYYEVVTDPSDELYEEVTEFYREFAAGDRNCDPNDYRDLIPKEHVRNGRLFMMVGRLRSTNALVSVFWVSNQTGEAVCPAYVDKFANEAIMLGLWEAQGHCRVQMWCKPLNPKNTQWILNTGMADMKRFEEEGIITWSPR